MPVRKSRKKCLHGRKKSARRGCKSRPGPKRKSRKVVRRSRKKSMRRSRCQYGRKKSARRGCKSRPGPKRRSRRRSVRRSTRRRVRRSKTYKYNMNHSDPHMLKKQLKDIKNIMDPIIKEQVKQFKFKYGYKMQGTSAQIVLRNPIQPWQVPQNSPVKKAQWSDFASERKNRRDRHEKKAFQADAISVIINIFIIFLIYFFVSNSFNDSISYINKEYASTLSWLKVAWGVAQDQYTPCTETQFTVDVLLGATSVVGQGVASAQGMNVGNIPTIISSPNSCQAKLANMGTIPDKFLKIIALLTGVLAVGRYPAGGIMKLFNYFHNKFRNMIFDHMVPYDEQTDEIVGTASTVTQQPLSPFTMFTLQKINRDKEVIQQRLQKGQPLLIKSSNQSPTIYEIDDD